MQGHIIGVDEFLELCKHWKRLTDKFPKNWVDPKPKACQMVCHLFKATHSPAHRLLTASRNLQAPLCPVAGFPSLCLLCRTACASCVCT